MYYSSCMKKKNTLATLENNLAVPLNFNLRFLYDLAIPCLGICSRLKIYVQTETCTQMFTEALFRMAK